MSVAPQTKEGSISYRQIIFEDVPEGYVKYVRERESLLLMNTNWHNNYKYILYTRTRTQYITNASNFTNLALRYDFSIDMWGGATFDVAMIFLNGCPLENLETLREKVTDVPFQMLLRGANDLGYTNYPDKIVHKFGKQDYKSSVEAFHLLNYLNYTKTLNIGVDAASSAGGFVEGILYYTGYVPEPKRGK